LRCFVISYVKVCNANGKLSESDKETAQILCEQFQQVYAEHGHPDLVKLVSDSFDDLSASELFTDSDVYKKLCMF